MNRHLQFTHGFGAVMTPVGGVAAEGRPQFLVKDIPPQGEPKIDEPRIYYGELTNDYVIVNSAAEEFDYPQEGTDARTRYSGKGGVGISSLWDRLLFTLRFAELSFRKVGRNGLNILDQGRNTLVCIRIIQVADSLTNFQRGVLRQLLALWQRFPRDERELHPHHQQRNQSKIQGCHCPALARRDFIVALFLVASLAEQREQSRRGKDQDQNQDDARMDNCHSGHDHQTHEPQPW